MSYSPEQMYPSAFTPDANFLGGKFKNSTAPGVYDGTPLDNLLFNQTLALLDAAMIEAGFDYNNTEDTPQDSQLHKALQATRQVEPLNNDYNGCMDPDHQSSLPSDAGYPGNSGSPTTYGLDNEISLGIRSGIAGNSVSSDADGWIFSGSIYKEYTMTPEQIALINVNSVNVFVKDESGVAYFWKNGDTGVTVSKPTSTTLRVTLSSEIFGVITKLWRFFVTEKVGYVGELSPNEAEFAIRGFLLIEDSTGEARIYRDGSCEQWITVSQPSGNLSKITGNFIVEIGSPTNRKISQLQASANGVASDGAEGSLVTECAMISSTQFQAKVMLHNASTISAVSGNTAIWVYFKGYIA